MTKAVPWLLAGALLPVMLSCGDATRASTDQNAAEQQAINSRITAAQSELERINAEITKQREEARFMECKASIERVKADLHAARAECMFALASQAKCEAKVERDKGDSTLFGCILGIGVAAATGGAAAPYALGGCASGRAVGELAATECPVPECMAEQETIAAQLLAKNGWSEFPQCGGAVRFKVETPLLTLEGGLIVIDPGPLGKAGVREQDILVYAAGERTRSMDDFYAILARSGGTALELRYVREERIWVGSVDVPKNWKRLRFESSPASMAKHRYGCKILSIPAGSPAVGLKLEGNYIRTVDGADVTSADHLRDLLRYRRTGDTVALGVAPSLNAATRAQTVTLGERRTASEL